jgi:hypothetical protein
MRGCVRLFGGLLAVALLSACGHGDRVVRPSESGAYRPDGIVAMSSTVSLFMPYEPDWSIAAHDADGRCRRWGYKQPSQLAGSRKQCLAWDRHGRCMETRLIQYYECAG